MSQSPKRPGRPPAQAKQAALVKEMSRAIRRALFDALIGSDSVAANDQAVLTVGRASEPIAPARLAAAHPGGAAARADAHQLYERCLKHYRENVRAHEAGLDVDDVGAAVACFVAANIQALHGITATPETLLRLERQLGGVALRSSAWATASARERQCYFEQMAILAVLIGETSAQAVHQGPAAIANVRSAARAYLQQLLGLQADSLTLGPEGLSVLEASAEPDPPGLERSAQ
jgi:hypothetical protein